MWIALLSLAQASSVTVMDGPRPEKDLLVAAAGRKGPLQACFKGSTETITLQIKIDTDGLVSDARYGTSASSVEIPRCLVSESLRMRTPPRPSDPAATTFEWKVSVAALGEAVPDDRPPAGEFTVRGKTDVAKVQQTLEGAKVQFNYCHKRELMRNPTVQGRLDVHFTVDAGGLAQDGSIQNSTVGNPQIEECALSRARALRYPPSADGNPYLVAWPIEYPAPAP